MFHFGVTKIKLFIIIVSCSIALIVLDILQIPLLPIIGPRALSTLGAALCKPITMSSTPVYFLSHGGVSNPSASALQQRIELLHLASGP